MSTDDTIRQLRLVVPTSEAELATDRLWCAGAGAIEEVAEADDLIELRTVLGGSTDSVRSRLGDLPAAWSIRFVDVDLRPANTWREFAQPIVVADDLCVVPAWWSGPVPDCDTVLAIEPGAAFGLGDHPTTRLCLAVLNAMDLSDKRVLDVGCGSGVLAVLAARRGARMVRALDISAAAVDATIANASRNDVDVAASTTPVSAVADSYDVIVANLLAPILVAVADDLIRLLAPGGRLVISGILDGRFDHVVEALSPLEVAATRREQVWAAVELVGPSK